MSDDFGTVNVRRGDRAREIEVMRQQYRTHRDTLQRLAADAPTDHLAAEYQRLSEEIETALAKLDELERRNPTGTGSTPLPPPRMPASAGDRPLATPPRSSLNDAPMVAGDSPVDPAPNATSRVVLIMIAGLIVLGGIVWLIWHGSARHGAATSVVEQPVTPTDTAVPSTEPSATPVTQTVAPAAGKLKITPALADYGMIRKGTRAVRQFEVMNNGSTPITVQVSRSACRCLYYDYHDKVPPKGKETITVTIDGAKAKAGPLSETLAVTAKEDHSIAGEMTVQATIK